MLDDYMAWSFEWAATGIRPLTDYDREWNSAKLAGAGKAFLTYKNRKVRLIVIEFRRDWDQYSGGWGFPRPNQYRFCWKCPCIKDCTHDDDQSGFPEYSHPQLMRILQKNTIDVLVGLTDLREIWSALEFDWRKDGAHGRVIARPLIVYDFRSRQHVALLKFDRLEMEGICRDIHVNSSSLPGKWKFPFRVAFWRKHPDSNFSFRCLLFRYFRLEYLMIDDLHTLDQGPAARLGGHTLALAISSGKVYNNPCTEAGCKEACVLATRELRAWKKIAKVKQNTIKRVNLPGLSLAGDLKAQGHLNCKAGEARAFLPFALITARRLVPHFGEKAQHLVSAIESLLQVYKMLSSADRETEHDRLGDLLDECSRQSQLAGVRLINKFHLMRHLRSVARVAGNPARFSAYIDESKNADTVKLAQKAKTPDFNSRILAKDFLQYHSK